MNIKTEILQSSKLSNYNGYSEQQNDEIGLDISCNLASLNIVNVMEQNSLKETVYSAMDIMTNVSITTDIKETPAVARANKEMHSVGLGCMNMAGMLAKNYIPYGSPESLEFTDVFFNMMNYYTLMYSMEKAKETKETYLGYENSTYASGEYFENRGEILPESDIVKDLFAGWEIPSDKDWKKLQKDIKKHGLFHS